VTVDARTWVAGREPAPPPALAAQVARALDAVPSELAIVDACLHAAEDTLGRVLSAPAGRETALDLLTADALVTYAFEAAGEEPDRLGHVAREAMARLSRLGGGAVTGDAP
jgi:hypothetical protein